MAESKDILLDDNFDFIFESGDFKVGDDKLQRQRLLLSTQPGDWKQHPTTGVGVQNFVEDDDISLLFREVRHQFARDGLKIFKMNFNGSELDVEVR